MGQIEGDTPGAALSVARQSMQSAAVAFDCLWQDASFPDCVPLAGVRWSPQSLVGCLRERVLDRHWNESARSAETETGTLYGPSCGAACRHSPAGVPAGFPNGHSPFRPFSEQAERH